MLNATLRDQLARLRKRLLLIGGLSGFGWGAAAALGVMLLAGAVDALVDLPPLLRMSAVGAALLAVIALAVIFLWRAWQRSHALSLARTLDRAAGAEGEILSGVSLAESDARSAAWSPLTSGLAQMAVARAAELARRAPETEVIPARPLRRSYASFGALCAVALLLVLCMPNLASTQWWRFADPYGDHPPWSAVQLQVEPGDAEVVYGKGLDVFVTPSGPPVDEVELVIGATADSPGETLLMLPETDGRWSAALTGLVKPTDYFVRATGARSRKYRIEILTVPRIEEVGFEIIPPSYTNRPAYHGPLPKEGIAGLPGTEVKLRARSNRPLAGGTLAFDSGSAQRRLKAGQTGDSEVAGSFVIERNDRIEIQVVDTAGQQSSESFTAPVTVLADEAPAIQLVQPQEFSFATPDIELPVSLAAEDDYGVQNVRIFRKAGDGEYEADDVPVAAPPPTRWSQVVPLSISTLGLKPGDELRVFARAEDNRPESPQGAESAVSTIRIISQEDFERMVRAEKGLEMLLAKYQEARRRVESAADEVEKLRKQLEKLPADGGLAESKREELERLTKQMREEAEAIRELAKKPLPYEMDEQLNKDLEALAESLDKAAEGAESLAGQPGATNETAAKELERLAEELNAGREKFDEQTMEPLEQLAGVYPLMEAQARFVELAQQQRGLEERLSSLKKREQEATPDEQRRMRELEAGQRQIRDDLRELLDDIEARVAQLPPEPKLDKLRTTATEFAKECRKCGAAGEMADAETQLAGFNGRQGHRHADKAADLLEKLLSQCNGMGGDCKQCLGDSLSFRPGLGECAGKTLEQLLAEAGFRPGNGQGNAFGTGVGGGYSARRSAMENIGLYGQLPTFSESSGGGQKQDRHLGAGEHGLPVGGNGNEARLIESAGIQSATGAAEASVPPRYRRRVGAYFQRIADEASQEGRKP